MVRTGHVVVDELGQHPPEVKAAEDHQVVEALAANGPDPAFGEGAPSSGGQSRPGSSTSPHRPSAMRMAWSPTS
jgi:hypothetical protein